METKNQFGVMRLLLLTTMVALGLSVLVRFKWDVFAVSILGTWMFLNIAWLTIRGPWLWSELRRLRRERRERRARLNRELEQRQMQSGNAKE